MRKIVLLLTLFVLASTYKAGAQVTPVTLPGTSADSTVGGGTMQSSTIQNQNTAAPMTAGDSLKMAITNLKTAFSDVSKLFSRKSDTVLIVISDVEYDNNGLSLLKENLKKLKSVRSVGMHYNAKTAILEVACKGKPESLWEALPADARTAFKVTEVGNANIALRLKEKAL